MGRYLLCFCSRKKSPRYEYIPKWARRESRSHRARYWSAQHSRRKPGSGSPRLSRIRGHQGPAAGGLVSAVSEGFRSQPRGQRRPGDRTRPPWPPHNPVPERQPRMPAARRAQRAVPVGPSPPPVGTLPRARLWTLSTDSECDRRS